MKSLQSVWISFLLSTVLFVLAGGTGWYFLRDWPLCWPLVAVFFLLYVLWVWMSYIRPVVLLGAQVRALFGGKEYKMIRTLRKDEIGDMTHFFNRITRSIEEVIGAVEQGQRLETEVTVAREIQQNVLPKSVSSVPYLDIVVKSKPAAEMGGDSFDFLNFEEETFCYIGDATGHGIPAALIMMMVNILMHAMCRAEYAPKDILVAMNHILYPRMLKTRFMTVTLLHWHHKERTLQFSGAGHESVFIYRRAQGVVEEVKSGGIALGMIADTSAITQNNILPFDEGDVIMLYSDGITEATDEEGKMYTEARLKQVFAKAAAADNDADRMFAEISRDYGAFVRGVPQADDVTLMIMAHINDAQGSQHIALSGSEGEGFWA